MALDRKIAYINLTTGDVEIKPIPLEMRKKIYRRPGNGRLSAL